MARRRRREAIEHDQDGNEPEEAHDRVMAQMDAAVQAKFGRSALPTDIPLNCPYCGQGLVNVPSDGPAAYYQCAKDGLLVLPSDGRLRRTVEIVK